MSFFDSFKPKVEPKTSPPPLPPKDIHGNILSVGNRVSFTYPDTWTNDANKYFTGSISDISSFFQIITIKDDDPHNVNPHRILNTPKEIKNFSLTKFSNGGKKRKSRKSSIKKRKSTKKRKSRRRR